MKSTVSLTRPSALFKVLILAVLSLGIAVSAKTFAEWEGQSWGVSDPGAAQDNPWEWDTADSAVATWTVSPDAEAWDVQPTYEEYPSEDSQVMATPALAWRYEAAVADAPGAGGDLSNQTIVCQKDSDCDDGKSCTVDQCDPSGLACNHSTLCPLEAPSCMADGSCGCSIEEGWKTCPVSNACRRWDVCCDMVHTPCVSAPNACGQTNVGTYDCEETCDATPPSNDTCLSRAPGRSPAPSPHPTGMPERCPDGQEWCSNGLISTCIDPTTTCCGDEDCGGGQYCSFGQCICPLLGHRWCEASESCIVASDCCPGEDDCVAPIPTRSPSIPRGDGLVRCSVVLSENACSDIQGVVSYCPRFTTCSEPSCYEPTGNDYCLRSSRLITTGCVQGAAGNPPYEPCACFEDYEPDPMGGNFCVLRSSSW